jgi:O-antigen ligase
MSGFGIFMGILLGQSRIVQGVLGLYTLWVLVRTFRGQYKHFLVFFFFALGLWFVPNPFVERFLSTFSNQNQERIDTYYFDRIAFWHAHWEMIKEKPLLGHGIDLNPEYRIPYYDKIGLHDLERKYEAHNMFIQILANGGIVGLLFFLLWLCSIFKKITSLQSFDPWASRVATQTLCVWLLASLTQNSFQDSVVRYCLTILYTGFLCLLAPSKHHNRAHSS